MTKREKVLASLVGGAVAVLLNIFLISFFTKNHRALKQDLARKESHLKGMHTLIADRALWEHRAAWIAANQPKLEDSGSAGVKLMEEVRDLAKRHEVLITPGTYNIGTPSRKENYTSVPVTVETKSTWKALVNFLADLQAPEKFIVIENAHLNVDSADKTQMQGRFTIAKWYAPQ